MIDTHKWNIRPAARHIFTIGKDLILNSIIAIIELVKNSYDADAENVLITFEKKNEYTIQISIQDDGHGMSYNTIIYKWMVPSTDDKLNRRYSNKGRLMQGSKGIGRYAASILGSSLYLESVDQHKEKNWLRINWSDFEKDDDYTNIKYLDEINIEINTEKSDETNGTKLVISGDKNYLEYWSDDKLNNLIKELNKLISPLQKIKKEIFKIDVQFINFQFEKYNNNIISITPYEIIDLFDYQLIGVVKKEKIENINQEKFIEKNKLTHAIEKKIAKKSVKDNFLYTINYNYYNAISKENEQFNDIIEFESGQYSGKVEFDLRVFDREPKAIDDLIQRGLIDSVTGQFLNKKRAKELLNEATGIYIFRGGFRLRPFGEPGYDWLNLDRRRVQKPSKGIGHNQIIGFVTIEGENDSGLIETSARDGLKENNQYNGLIELIQKTLIQLEERRFDFRKKTGRGRNPTKIEQDIDNVIDFNTLKNEITIGLKKRNINPTVIKEITALIDKDEKQKAKRIDDIKETIAIYEEHVTLGKIIMVILHESRKPLSYLKNQIPLLNKKIEKLKSNYSELILESIKSILKDLLKQTHFFISLIDKLEPFAIKKRNQVNLNLDNTIKQSTIIYENELIKNSIKLNLNCDKNLEIFGYEEDFNMIFTNLMDNSIYWLLQSHKEEKFIEVNVVVDDNKNIIIDFIDNAIGIEKKYIEEDKIFEPGFSTKNKGTGLGLAIVVEALTRNNGIIKAIYSENGAYLRLKIKLEFDNE